MYDEKAGKWTLPEGAREYTTTRSFYAVQVKEPREFPGAMLRRICTLDGTVITEQVVINTSPFPPEQGMFYAIHKGDFVLYPNDPSTSMLQVQSYRDFTHWHPEVYEQDDDAFNTYLDSL